MKKIVTVTFQRADNYGAALQTYALQYYLKEKGYDVETLDFNDLNIAEGYKIFTIVKTNKKAFIKSIAKDVLFLNRKLKRKIYFNKFRKKYIKLTNGYNDTNELKKHPPKANTYIVGSDQVWNTDITKGLQDVYSLNFGEKNINRISYAASIGNSIIYDYEKKFFTDKLKIIDKISVREEKGKELLNEIGFNDVAVTIDPTLLVEPKIWFDLSNKIKVPRRKYLVSYVFEKNSDYYKLVNYLAKNENKPIVYLEMFNKFYKEKTINKYGTGPIEFIALIRNADKVLCTSFHATVFSIIFHKDFYVVPHKSTGNRVTSLLKQLGLEDRILYSFNDYKKNESKKNEIDWNNVDKKLDNLRKESGEWLINAIESEE